MNQDGRSVPHEDAEELIDIRKIVEEIVQELKESTKHVSVEPAMAKRPTFKFDDAPPYASPPAPPPDMPVWMPESCDHNADPPDWKHLAEVPYVPVLYDRFYVTVECIEASWGLRPQHDKCELCGDLPAKWERKLYFASYE